MIGPNANSRAALVGNYQGTSSRYITPLEGIQQYVGDDVRVTYAEGCHLYKNKVEGLGEDKDRFKEAVIAAEHADVVVLCLGLDATVEGEEGDAGNEYASGDKLGLNLPGLQEELLETITAVGKPVVSFSRQEVPSTCPGPRSMYRLFLTAGIRVRAAEKPWQRRCSAIMHRTENCRDFLSGNRKSAGVH